MSIDDGAYLVQPVNIPGSHKYAGYQGGRGLFTHNTFVRAGLSYSLTEALVNACNNGLAEGTWRGYRSAKKHLEECSRYTGVRMGFPLHENQTLCLIAYLYAVKGLKGTTIDNILSAVRMLHLTQGHAAPFLRPAAVQLAIKGFKNRDEEVGRGKTQRQPVTLKLLQLLYINLKVDKSIPEKLKSTVLSVATLAFFGAFRGGELISKTSTRYDLKNTLLKRDIWISRSRVDGVETDVLNVRLKSNKNVSFAQQGTSDRGLP